MGMSKLWLSSDGDVGDAPDVPFYFVWTDTSHAVKRNLVSTRRYTPREVITAPTPESISPAYVLLIQFISEPFVPQVATLSSGFRVSTFRIQSGHTCDISNNLWKSQLYLPMGYARFVGDDGSVKKEPTGGPPSAGDNITPFWSVYDGAWVEDSPRGGQINYHAFLLSPYPYQIEEGDRLILEVGFRATKTMGHEDDPVLESDVSFYIGDDASRDIPSLPMFGSDDYKVLYDANGWELYRGSGRMFGNKSGSGSPRYQKPRSPTRYGLHMQHPKLPPTGDFLGEEILG